jgi:hypothetical protein
MNLTVLVSTYEHLSFCPLLILLSVTQRFFLSCTLYNFASTSTFALSIEVENETVIVSAWGIGMTFYHTVGVGGWIHLVRNCTEFSVVVTVALKALQTPSSSSCGVGCLCLVWDLNYRGPLCTWSSRALKPQCACTAGGSLSVLMPSSLQVALICCFEQSLFYWCGHFTSAAQASTLSRPYAATSVTRTAQHCWPSPYRKPSIFQVLIIGCKWDSWPTTEQQQFPLYQGRILGISESLPSLNSKWILPAIRMEL